MKTNEQLLLKHFAIVLRNRSNGKIDPMSLSLIKYLSRKDLIEIIKKIHAGTIPKGLDLALMENQELLSIIKNEMYIIAFITNKWSEEQKAKKLLGVNIISKNENRNPVPIPKLIEKKKK